jgi:putative endonuclease
MTATRTDTHAIWHLYILRCERDTFYTGITTDVERRFKEHLAGEEKAAKYTRMAKPLEMAYSLPIGSKDIAARIEYHIKRLSRKEKESLVADAPNLVELLKFLNIGDWM